MSAFQQRGRFKISTFKLPIWEHHDEIQRVIRQNRSLVLQAPPGAGKTTGLPLMLRRDDGWTFQAASDGQLWCIQPRRLAARMAAMRVADQIACRVGQQVGYHVRSDRRESNETRILMMTPGMFLRRMLADSFLENVVAVVLDEFHERSIEMDLALSMTHLLRGSVRDDLRLIVMSATLEPQPIVDFLGDASGIVTRGRSFPVATVYRPLSAELFRSSGASRGQWPAEFAAAIADAAAQQSAGDVLVFLPGVGEIRLLATACSHSSRLQDFDIRILHGGLGPDKQDAALRPSGRRRIILSTNVAETSVTIDGVTVVVDSGKARVSRMNPRTGLPGLAIESISVASADQRGGRAGRTSPGTAIRLWDERTHRSRPARDLPEILRGDLCPSRLWIRAWDAVEPDAMKWLDSPSGEAVERADETLRQLAAIDAGGAITPLGKQMTNLPMHPRWGRMLIQAQRDDCECVAALVAAMLSERDPFRALGRDAPVDLDERVAILIEDVPATTMADDAVGRSRDLNAAAPDRPSREQVWQNAGRFLRSLRGVARHGRQRDEDDRQRTRQQWRNLAPEVWQRVLLSGFPDRVCQRRGMVVPKTSAASTYKNVADGRARMVGGKGVRLPPGNRLDRHRFFLAIDVEDRGEDAQVRLAAAVDREQLSADLISVMTEPHWDETAGAIRCRRVTRYLDLVLDETPTKMIANDATAAMLASVLESHFDQYFPPSHTLVQFLARIECLRAAGLWPDSPTTTSPTELRNRLIRKACERSLSVDQVLAANWKSITQSSLDYKQTQVLRTDAPENWRLPGGREVRLDYCADRKPRLETRIGDFYGVTEHPRVLGGRVPIQLHLQNPAGRTEQITEDLPGFWSGSYALVRKAMRGRYPKHDWPEDPATASPPMPRRRRE
ncbi:MAG: ATP-dependent helicase HrpB [Planctomycetota bacterium]